MRVAGFSRQAIGMRPHRESGIYENGDVIGNCAEAIGEAVAVNDTHVFVGAKNGIKQSSPAFIPA